MTPDELHALPVFAALTPEQLGWLADQVEERLLAPDELLFTEVDLATAFYVILAGELLITKRIGREETVLDHLKPGMYFGEIPLVTGRPYRVNGRVQEPTRVLQLSPEAFGTLLTSSRATMSEILRTMARRVRAAEVLVQQRERTLALGAFAAELAHELNNPAAAARRAADHLQTAFADVERQALALGQLQLHADQLDRLAQVQRDALAQASAQPPLDPLAQSDREEALITWLDVRDVPDSWELAPALVGAGLDPDQLDALDQDVPAEALATVLGWLVASLTATRLLDQARQSTARISDLVATVKRYAHMDQAPIQQVDVHEGLENTLTILGHKLRGGVSLIREYDRSTPQISAYASELNQVWTNLIDNALDAVGDKGHVWVRTGREDGAVRVEIADDGPGIPPELQARIFQPFFTTKGSKGTGLGLDIAHRIVVQRHGGELQVISQPGDTRFVIRLPLDHALK